MMRLAAPALALVLAAGAYMHVGQADSWGTPEATPFRVESHDPEIGGKCVRDLARTYPSWPRDGLIAHAADVCKIDRALAAIIVDDALRR